MIWFCSDLHLGHNAAAMDFRKERGYPTVAAHDLDIIETLNRTIGKNDVVWHLGDFCYGKTAEDFNHYASQLVGHWRFIPGNHDRALRRAGRQEAMIVDLPKHQLTLCHYPMISWNGSHYGFAQLHGHHHDSVVASKFPGKRLNVCWEVVGYRPVSLDEVRQLTEGQTNWDRVDKKKDSANDF